MGFGSYDESEQDNGSNKEDAEGENMTQEFKQAGHDGEDSIEDESVSDMMGHL